MPDLPDAQVIVHRAALKAIAESLTHVPHGCRYHGSDFGKLGFEWSMPRCDSCKQPYRVYRAVEELQQLARGRSGQADVDAAYQRGLTDAGRAGYDQAVAVLRDVARRTGSPASRWAADCLAADPDGRASQLDGGSDV